MVEQENDFEIKKYQHEDSDAPFFAILAATTVLRAAESIEAITLKGMLPAAKQITPVMDNGHYGTTPTTPFYTVITQIVEIKDSSLTVNITFEEE